MKDFKYEILDDNTINIIEYKGNNIDLANHNPPITSIGERAFYGNNNIEKMIIPDNIKFIHEYAFSCCDNIKKSSDTRQRFSD